MKKTVRTRYIGIESYKYAANGKLVKGEIRNVIILDGEELSQISLQVQTAGWSSISLNNVIALSAFTKVLLKTLRKLDELEIIDINDFFINSFPDTEE